MTTIPFSQLNLTPNIERAIGAMGFHSATPVQSEAIPLIRTGVDVIARSQTGTGKTVAFAIPAIEKVDSHEDKATIQVLILCPTRELAMQVADEIRKVARFETGIRPVEIYGGAAIDKQCIRLRRANIVVGTPGRVMDHMRRKTIKLSSLKMVILDEADEMLNMGFREDIETILGDTPDNRQTILFSATMPPQILKLARDFQKDPQIIEIDKGQVTIAEIEQNYIDVPHNRKKDALVALLGFHAPGKVIIFSNTKKMVDELTELLSSRDFSVESIHSDIKQSQRTAVMQGFKHGRTTILIATDIAARGIDVSDVDLVINFDIPANSEYYVHRIGRTGRAGKSGQTITFCSSNREVSMMQNIARESKSAITRIDLPTTAEIKKATGAKINAAMEEALQSEAKPFFSELVEQLSERGFSSQQIAATAMQLYFERNPAFTSIPHMDKIEKESFERVEKIADKSRRKPSAYETILINIGSSHRAAANHIIGAIVDRTALLVSDIGKVEVFPEQTVVEIPAGRGDEILNAMAGCKIVGRPVKTERLAGPYKKTRLREPRGVKKRSTQKQRRKW